MQPSRPMFSVVVPTYNQELYLGAALDSLRAQTCDDWEAIVVNDGSTDGTAKILQAYCLKDSRIKALHTENSGVASALNTGIKHTVGEWVCWLSSDDLFDKRKLDVHRSAIALHSDCKFFYTGYSVLYDDSQRIFSTPFLKLSRGLQLIEMFFENRIAGNTVCVNKEALASCGAFNPEYPYAQDYEMWLRLLARFPARYLRARTSIVRIHPQQGTSRFPEATRYNSAKAAISFLNEQSFESLFPLLNLTQREPALSALSRSLWVASNDKSMLNSIGPHRALISRIATFALGRYDKPDESALLGVVRVWAKYATAAYAGSTFALGWRALEDMSAQHGSKQYLSVDALDVMVQTYLALLQTDRVAAAPLERYLREIEHITVSSARKADNMEYFSSTLVPILSEGPSPSDNLAVAQVTPYDALSLREIPLQRRYAWVQIAMILEGLRDPSVRLQRDWWSFAWGGSRIGILLKTLFEVLRQPSSVIATVIRKLRQLIS